MRTTLSLDDDVFESASRRAKSRKVSLGKAVSDLVRKGLKEQAQVRRKQGLVVFDLPADSPTVTPEMVKQLESEPQ